jgi:hypothetical protein
MAIERSSGGAGPRVGRLLAPQTNARVALRELARAFRARAGFRAEHESALPWLLRAGGSDHAKQSSVGRASRDGSFWGEGDRPRSRRSEEARTIGRSP